MSTSSFFSLAALLPIQDVSGDDQNIYNGAAHYSLWILLCTFGLVIEKRWIRPMGREGKKKRKKDPLFI
jgi:hypothetical protein